MSGVAFLTSCEVQCAHSCLTLVVTLQDVQGTIKRLVKSLEERKYNVWFGECAYGN